MQHFKEYIKNKRVVIVGPSSHLMGLGTGNLINGYDIVCRVNDVGTYEYEEDYGSRTDVLFYTCTTFTLDRFLYEFNKYKRFAENIQYVVCPVVKVQHDFGGNAKDNFDKINIYNLKFTQIEEKVRKQYCDMVGVDINSGLTAILMMVDEVRELYVTGFSFYSQGNTYEKVYYKGKVEKRFEEDNFNPWEGHPQKQQLDFFKYYIMNKYYGVVKIDDFLEKVLYGI